MWLSARVHVRLQSSLLLAVLESIQPWLGQLFVHDSDAWRVWSIGFGVVQGFYFWSSCAVLLFLLSAGVNELRLRAAMAWALPWGIFSGIVHGLQKNGGQHDVLQLVWAAMMLASYAMLLTRMLAVPYYPRLGQVGRRPARLYCLYRVVVAVLFVSAELLDPKHYEAASCIYSLLIAGQSQVRTSAMSRALVRAHLHTVHVHVLLRCIPYPHPLVCLVVPAGGLPGVAGTRRPQRRCRRNACGSVDQPAAIGPSESATPTCGVGAGGVR